MDFDLALVLTNQPGHECGRVSAEPKAAAASSISSSPWSLPSKEQSGVNSGSTLCYQTASEESVPNRWTLTGRM